MLINTHRLTALALAVACTAPMHAQSLATLKRGDTVLVFPSTSSSPPVVTPAPTPTTTPTPAPSAASVKLLFTDSFESGDFTRAQTTVRWTDHNSVVDVASFARTGNKAARFRQGDGGDNAELRFDGLPQLSEVFLQFYLYQPSGKETPGVGTAVAVPGTKNDKFFRLFGPNNGTGTIAFGASTWAGKLGPEYTYNDGTGAAVWGMGQGVDAEADWQLKTPFIGNPLYVGRWVRVRIRCKVASAANNDGAIQIWLNDSLVQSKTHLAAYALHGVGNVFESGYLLGWANNGFPKGQIMYVDDVTISTGGFAN